VANYVNVYWLRSLGYHVLKFIAIDLQLYNIFKMTRASLIVWHTK